MACVCQLGGCFLLLGENSMVSLPVNLSSITSVEKCHTAKNSNMKVFHRAGFFPNSGILLVFKTRAVMQNQRLKLEVSIHNGNKSHNLWFLNVLISSNLKRVMLVLFEDNFTKKMEGQVELILKLSSTDSSFPASNAFLFYCPDCE